MEFNQYNLYAMNADITKTDKVDNYKKDLMLIHEYDEAKNFIIKHFGSVEGAKWVDYPELDKKVYIFLNDEKVEFCALKDKKQYWGKGWKLVSSDDAE